MDVGRERRGGRGERARVGPHRGEQRAGGRRVDGQRERAAHAAQRVVGVRDGVEHEVRGEPEERRAAGRAAAAREGADEHVRSDHHVRSIGSGAPQPQPQWRGPRAVGARPRARPRVRALSSRPMRTDLVVATPTFLDLTFVGLDAMPVLGEERFAGDLLRSPGGGAITAVGAARLGLSAAVAAPLGDDPAGALLREALAKRRRPGGRAARARRRRRRSSCRWPTSAR